MAALQPLSPDDVYCVYCHAVAAGPCAVCAAICCGDCVELVLGLTTQRAVCRSCLRQGQLPADVTVRRRLTVLLAAIVLGGGLTVLWFGLRP